MEKDISKKFVKPVVDLKKSIAEVEKVVKENATELTSQEILFLLKLTSELKDKAQNIELIYDLPF